MCSLRMGLRTSLIRKHIFHLAHCSGVRADCILEYSVLNPGLAAPAPANLVPTRSPAPAFVGASSVAEVPFTSAIAAPTTTMSVPAMATTAPMIGSNTSTTMSISGSVVATGSMTTSASMTTASSGSGSTSSSAGPATYTGGAAAVFDSAGGFLIAAAVAGGVAAAM